MSAIVGDSFSQRRGANIEVIRAENPGLPVEGYKCAGAPPKTWPWGFVQAEGNAIAALLDRAQRETPIGEIIDVQKAKAAAQNASRFTLVTQIKSIFSVIGIAHTLLGEGESAHDKVN